MTNGNSEAFNQREFELHSADYPGLVVFRNNCGALTDSRGVLVRYGVGHGHGGSDFIGWWNALFVAFEIKADDDNTAPSRLAAQENFIAQVNAAGGRAGFVRRPVDIGLILQGRGCVRLKEYPRARLAE